MAVRDFEVNINNDAGNKLDYFYKQRLSPLRYSIRSRLLPYLSKETRLINEIQKRYRTPFLDTYFSWSANLAAHTFYVLMLPIPFWLGYTSLARDLVWVLGLGIFVLGLCKDYTCLPRPRSPPVHRITMSGYTAKEYGFPSSHSANATSVTLVLLCYFYSSIMHYSLVSNILIFLTIAVYYFTLVFGRVYCGMHGLLDIIGGSIIGILVTIFRFKLAMIWDPIILNEYALSSYTSSLISIIVPLIVISSVAASVYFHVVPAENCPCFEDSIAFIGVLMGLELSMFAFARASLFSLEASSVFNIESKATLPYSFEYFGIFKTVIRLLVGMGLTLLWKVLSKMVLIKVLPVIYRFFGINVSRNAMRSSLVKKHNENSIGDFPGLVKSITNTTVADTVNNQNGFYNNNIDPGMHQCGAQIHKYNDIVIDDEPDTGCQAFLPRYDIIIVSRLIIYAGICTMVTFGFTIVVRLLGLDYNPYLEAASS